MRTGNLLVNFVAGGLGGGGEVLRSSLRSRLAMGPRAKAYPTNGSPNSLPRTATGSASAVEAK
jgi:hypothetical protein